MNALSIQEFNFKQIFNFFRKKVWVMIATVLIFIAVGFFSLRWGPQISAYSEMLVRIDQAGDDHAALSKTSLILQPLKEELHKQGIEMEQDDLESRLEFRPTTSPRISRLIFHQEDGESGKEVLKLWMNIYLEHLYKLYFQKEETGKGLSLLPSAQSRGAETQAWLENLEQERIGKEAFVADLEQMPTNQDTAKVLHKEKIKLAALKARILILKNKLKIYSAQEEEALMELAQQAEHRDYTTLSRLSEKDLGLIKIISEPYVRKEVLKPNSRMLLVFALTGLLIALPIAGLMEYFQNRS